MRMRKIRRGGMWACVGLAGAIAIAWMLSAWYVPGFYRNDAAGTRKVEIRRGQLLCYSGNVSLKEDNGLQVSHQVWNGWRWWFESRSANVVGVKYWLVAAPLWPSWLLAVAIAVGLW